MITTKIKIITTNKMALLRAIGDIRNEIAIQPDMSITALVNQISFNKGESDYKYTLQVDDESEKDQKNKGSNM